MQQNAIYQRNDKDTILLDTDRYYLVNLDVLLGIFDAIAASYQH